MITINGFNLDPSAGYILEEVTYKHTPSRQILSQPVSRRPGDKIIANEWKNKVINLRGRMIAGTSSDLNLMVDTLQQNFAVQSLALSIDQGRTYTATLTDMQIPTQFYNNSMVEWSAEFTAFDPFAYGTAVTASGVVASGIVTYSGALTISGSVFNYPKLIIYPNASSIKEMMVTYVPTSETLTISGTFTANQPLVIDYDNFYFTNNGNQSDYLGIFSRWDVGSQNYTITTTSGTNAGFNYVWSYAPKYYQ